jgi:hypothetical protein
MKKGNPQKEKAPNSADKRVSWTIMLYIAADGALANSAVESLKQINDSIAQPADPTDQASVVVAAQFAVDAPAGQQIPRYVFDEHSSGSIQNSLKGYLNAPNNMTEQEALISFIKWVYSQPKCKASTNSALILWGHGPELLMQPPPGQQVNDPSGDPKNDNNSLYLSPEELRVALTEGLPEGRFLEIIGFDACSMSMFEVAYELREKAHYMVASQEEVPDLSFHYNKLVPVFRKYGGNVETLLKAGVYKYVRTYDDYLCNSTTGMKRVTLSALRLSQCNALKDALYKLAHALRDARDESGLPPVLMEAREYARDFAGGLYIDLFDFCRKLQRLLYTGKTEDASTSESASQGTWQSGAGGLDWKDKIAEACQNVMDALKEDEDKEGSGKLLVLANCSADFRCHGVSLYLPYLSELQYGEMQQPMVKGGCDTIGKGFGAVLNRAASELLMSVRRQLIMITEAYYRDLALARDTDWYSFIAKLWSTVLVELAPDELDLRYSAQQAAVNSCRRDAVRRATPIPPNWPSYTGTSKFVGASPSGRVTVYVDPTLGAPGLENAQYLVNDADRIVTANDSLFGTTGGSVSVIIFAMGGATDGTGGASHMGCDYASGSALEICASFGNSARVSALLAALLSECSSGGDLCGISTGEALSRWCAATISNNALSDFATAPQWALDGMQDFVNHVDPTDQNPDSTGCAVAFLSWLMSQSYSLSMIAQGLVALGDDGTLAQLYAKLTSDLATNAWPKFSSAIQKLPSGVTGDDPFGALAQLMRPASSDRRTLGIRPLSQRQPFVAAANPERLEVVQSVKRLEQRFDSILSEPKLDNFDGSVSVRVCDDVGKPLPQDPSRDRGYFLPRAGQRCRLEISFAAGILGGKDVGVPYRPLRIQRGNTASQVTFDIFLDGRTVSLVKDRSSVTFDPNGKSPVSTFDFIAPNDRGEYELFVEIAQKNRLLQSLLIRLRVKSDPK